MTLILDMPETLAGEAETEAVDLEQMGIEATNGQAAAPPPPADAAADTTTPATAPPSENDSGLELESATTTAAEGQAAVVNASSNGEVIDAEYQITDPEEREAEERLCNCQLRIAALKRQLKYEKVELDEATEELESIRRRGERKDEPSPISDPPKPGEVTGEVIGVPVEEPTLPPPAPDGPTDWRSVPLASLSLKEATAKRLLEHDISTLGQLEDLRAKGNVKGVGLRSIKGIGDAKVTEIEDAVVAWFTKNPQPVVEQPVVEQAVDADVAAKAPAVNNASTETAATTDDYDPDTDNARKAITARATAINDGATNSLSKKIKDKSFWEAGQQHCRSGHPLTECGVIPGPEQDDWIRGYLAEKLLEEYEPTEETTE